MKKIFILIFIILLSGCSQKQAASPKADEAPKRVDGKSSFDLSRFKVRDGFQFSIFAENIKSPRYLAFDPNGLLLVSKTVSGEIAVVQSIEGGASTTQKILLSGLIYPHGLAIDCTAGKCQLYFTEARQISVADYDPDALVATNTRKLFDLPKSGTPTQGLAILEYEGRKKLFFSTLTTCESCQEKDERNGKLYMADLDGQDLAEFASGFYKNSFFVRHPDTGEIWTTNIEPEKISLDLPPDEIDIVEQGKDYGWPYCFGKNRHNDKADKDKKIDCSSGKYEPAIVELEPHGGSLGIGIFGPAWPEDLRGRALVAQHGSVYPYRDAGFRLVLIGHDVTTGSTTIEDFMSGWLQPDGVLGRPSGVLIGPDAIYISDDTADKIYLITMAK